MGITASNGIIPTSRQLWKKGNKSEGVPCPSGQSVSSYDALAIQTDFKGFLYQHIDSDSLILSILSKDHPKFLLEGIRVFQSADEEFQSILKSQIKTFESISSSGVKVKIKFYLNFHMNGLFLDLAIILLHRSIFPMH